MGIRKTLFATLLALSCVAAAPAAMARDGGHGDGGHGGGHGDAGHGGGHWNGGHGGHVSVGISIGHPAYYGNPWGHPYYGYRPWFYGPRYVYSWDSWHRGYWYHTWHNGIYGWWWIVGDDWFDYPAPVYPYPAYAYPGYAAPASPYEYATPPASGTPPAQSWYYCDNPKGYYPYVSSCPGGWRPVPSSPPGETKQ